VTVIADLALLPFALALGIGLFVGAEGIFDDGAVSIAAGAIGAGLALALWYGLPQLRKRFPAPYHRIVYAGENTEDMYRVGSALVTGATLPLGLGLAGDVYVVIGKISGSFAVGAVTGGLAFVLLTGLWYLYPDPAIVAHRSK
jgi:hypothetical protein